MNSNAQAMIFADEDETSDVFSFADDQTAEPWKVIIVDDEIGVHQVTKQTLARFRFDGRPLCFYSAYTREQAEKVIADHPDAAVILLDVVMAEEKAGLRLARYIREEVKNPYVRIILRTGQPEEAPEEQIIQEYDINDYKEKTELTARKLFTTMVTSLRSYRDIMTLDSNKRGLEKVLESSATLLEIQSVSKLASGILEQLASILSLRQGSKQAPMSSFAAVRELGGELVIMAATGEYTAGVTRGVREFVPAEILTDLERVFQTKHSMYIDSRLIKYFQSKNGTESIIYLTGVFDLNEWDRDLIDIFGMNVSIAFDNLYLNKEIEDTQKEIILTLGEFSETRSRETGNHVKRVAEYSKLLALKCGLSEEEAEIIRMASPMHDVGKLGIEDAILNKPGKLTIEEFEVIKAHGTLGYEILRNSNRKIMQTAALIALEHHEKFDGSGYPRGLCGEDIHIYGRITAIADVFDALGSERVYKKAWPLSDILDYFKRERGKHFDPRLLDLFFDNLPEFLAIRNTFADKGQ